jgi:putative oxidoreductase
MNKLKQLIKLYQQAVGYWSYLTPVFDLAIRGYLCWVFFRSGLAKIKSWDSTLSLFENEFSVPVLSPETAAWLGTATELSLPVLLLFGLGSRVAAGALFVFNIIAVISYPDLSAAGVNMHYLWGWLMLVIVFHGAGKLSLDALIKRWVVNSGER